MRNLPDSVMLFAAGFGTRMGALTRCRPKPLIEVAGRPLLDHALDVATTAGVARKVVNTHYLGAQIERHLAGRADVAISHEAPQILETGGGLRQALPLLGGSPVFTLNTDVVWTGANPLDELRTAWDPTRMDALLLLVDPEAARGHAGKGDFLVRDDGKLRRGAGAIYGGAQIICTRGLPEVRDPAFSLNLVWDRMLARGRLFGCLHRGGWCDVGRPEGIGIAEAMLAGAADG